ncbi:MAG: hypothetical protein HY784_03870 [Chloroflexi bacterium]|nr:hypothetical protein [Chloroflexota bacterium]
MFGGGGGVTATPTTGGGGGGAGTPRTATPTALPQTGLFDEGGGLPGMILIGLLLVAVVVVARRLRLSGAS